MTFNTDSTILNNTIIGINSLIPQKLKSLENNNSRNSNIFSKKTNLKQFLTINKSEINSKSKKLINDKRTSLNCINYKMNQKANYKQFNKIEINHNKNDIKSLKDNNRYQLSKITKTHKIKKNNFFQNKIIKKKSHIILNNSKKQINFLRTNKTFYDSNNKTNSKKLFYYKKMNTLNPLECNNLTKKKKCKRQVITIENIIDNNCSNINNKNIKVK